MSDTQSDVRKIAYGGLSLRMQLDRLIDRMLGAHRIAARVFFGSDGKVTPAARAWLAGIARDNFVAETTFVADDARQSDINEGRRQLALEILGSVHFDQDRLDELMHKKQEIEDGGR